ncbi:MAG: SDR family oxidoreductase, partial [Spirochaetaceae bacterium]|nr:SDR family oxidoreductase [Spirochaetaceae bacterium]
GTFAVNLKAPFFLSQEAIRMMSSHRDGYIINISSTAALQVPGGLASYGTSKMALAALSEAMYQVGKEHGIKVTVIYPGMTDTKMLRDFEPPVDPEKWMKPEDISNAVVFLLRQSKRVVIKELTPWAAGHDQI